MPPALSFNSCDDALGELGADALGAADHRLSPLATARCSSSAGERREDGERDARADALHRDQQAEPVALGGGGEADQADRILGDQHLGVQHHLVADRAELRTGCGSRPRRDSRRRRRRSPRSRRRSRRAGPRSLAIMPRLPIARAAGEMVGVGDRDGERVGGVGAGDLHAAAAAAGPWHGPGPCRRRRCRPPPS